MRSVGKSEGRVKDRPPVSHFSHRMLGRGCGKSMGYVKRASWV
jgi:hypothetical protein